MLNAILGSKLNQSQMFDEKGMRIPVTNILAGPCVVVRLKDKEADGYNAVVVGFGQRRPITLKKPVLESLNKAGLKEAPPRFLKELYVDYSVVKKENLAPGVNINVADVLKEGDFVEVVGTSSGKGFAGGVKRHGFKGGPRTHGQSDRERAPGSIGQSTTPGRVYKGKRMAGRMGQDRVTIKNIKVIKVDKEKNILTVKGLVPGKKNSLLIINKLEIRN